MEISHKPIIRERQLRDEKLGGISRSTFHRRYRHNPEFPRPVNMPDGGIAYWEHEIDAFLERRGHTDDPRANVAPLPSRWKKPEVAKQAGVGESG